MENDKNLNVVVLSGAGISAESGLAVFRGSGGLWNGYDIMEVASADGWQQNPKKVLEFYNMRRREMLKAQPNEAHKALARLEAYCNVVVVTQNVDCLHELGGSSNIIHLHGELTKSRSTVYPYKVYTTLGDVSWGDVCPRGAQLRPHIVFFGEEVPMIEPAAVVFSKADVVIVVGTSLDVYPAASLIYYAPRQSRKYVIDPHLLDKQNFETFATFRQQLP